MHDKVMASGGAPRYGKTLLREIRVILTEIR